MANVMAEKKTKWMKSAKWIYWIVTLLFVLPLMASGVTFLMGMQANVDGICTHLGYPVYLLKILGVAKILGGIAILYGRNPTLKEWAYAGFSFNMIGAAASYALHGDPFTNMIAPLILLALILMSHRQWKTGWM